MFNDKQLEYNEVKTGISFNYNSRISSVNMKLSNRIRSNVVRITFI
jgi:hypothetical protein